MPIAWHWNFVQHGSLGHGACKLLCTMFHVFFRFAIYLLLRKEQNSKGVSCEISVQIKWLRHEDYHQFFYKFLPQDRVCEFAKLTPVQLLEETEKAVGDPQLPEQHRTLIDKSRALKHVELSLEKNEATLNQLKERNAELEKDVERVRQRDELLAKAESMKKKFP
ncbi:unnamed protein product [Vicia faba]|uniref:Uncharacterized protein n=1 Tax=Vicia faba TaxID=3906 RepID=A0AAV0YZD5_VICFA|nr:unnamed protein product [Vicia faba]